MIDGGSGRLVLGRNVATAVSSYKRKRHNGIGLACEILRCNLPQELLLFNWKGAIGVQQCRFVVRKCYAVFR